MPNVYRIVAGAAVLCLVAACDGVVQSPDPGLAPPDAVASQDPCDGPTGRVEPCQPNATPLDYRASATPAAAGALGSVAVVGAGGAYNYLASTGNYNIDLLTTILDPGDLDGYGCVVARLSGGVPATTLQVIHDFVAAGGGYVGEWWGAGAAHSGLATPLISNHGNPSTFMSLYAGTASDGTYLNTGTPIHVVAAHPVTAGLPATFDGGGGTEFFVRPTPPLDPALTVLATHDGFGSTETALAAGTLPGGGNGVQIYFDAQDNAFDPELSILWDNAVGFACAPPNEPPAADAGDDQTVECTDADDGSTTVVLDGTGSTDSDGSIVSYEWSEGGSVIATGAMPTVELPGGSHTLTLTVTDDDGGQDTDDIQIDILDTTAPSIAFSLDQTTLWPPNHKLVTVATGIGATDACDAAPSVVVTVASNEPENDLGDGDTDADWVVTANDDGTFDVAVRAERSGLGTDRVYTITVTATDGTGNQSTASGEVTVPHDQGNGKAKGRG